MQPVNSNQFNPINDFKLNKLKSSISREYLYPVQPFLPQLLRDYLTSVLNPHLLDVERGGCHKKEVNKPRDQMFGGGRLGRNFIEDVLYWNCIKEREKFLYKIPNLQIKKFTERKIELRLKLSKRSKMVINVEIPDS